MALAEIPTTAQKSLFAPPPADGGLTVRQALVLRMVDERGGVTDVEAGRALHAAKGRCSKTRPYPFLQRSQSADGRCCDFGISAGREVLNALRRRGLLKRRQADGVWIRRGT